MTVEQFILRLIMIEYGFNYKNEKIYCAFCNKQCDYSKKYIIQKYKKYNSIGCSICNAKRNRILLLEKYSDKLKNYIIHDIETINNISKDKSNITNKKCNHTFNTTIGNLIYSNVNCPVCYNENRKFKKFITKSGEQVKKKKFSVEEVVKRLKNVSDNIIMVNPFTYSGVEQRTELYCTICKHEWKAILQNILNLGTGCPNCNIGKQYSKKSIKWLKFIELKENIVIQHAENGGEFKIINPETNKRIPVDGYCKETNTIYEFHGSIFHGDPAIYSDAQYPNPFKKKTAKELYNATIRKEELIKSLGYNLVVMWESEFDLINKMNNI